MSLRRRPDLTPAMLAANRRNAQKSTGPRSEQGKQRVRLNGLKHGLRCGSFRESLIKSGESAAPVDRNFLFLTLYLQPQKRYEVHRIADFARLLWSVAHWGRCHEVRTERADRLVKKVTTELELQGLLNAGESRIAGGRRGIPHRIGHLRARLLNGSCGRNGPRLGSWPR